MVTAARLSPDGTTIAATDDDGLLRLYNRDLTPIGALKGHFGPVNDIAWSPNSRTLATVGADKLCILWDSKLLKPTRTLRGHTHELTCACFTPKGTLLTTTSIDESTRVWNVMTGDCIHILSAHTEVVTCTDVSHDGTMILTGAADGLIRIWDTISGNCLKTLDSGSKIVTFAKFTPNSRFVVCTGGDGVTRIWDYIDVLCAKEYKGEADLHSRSVCFKDNQIFIAGPKEIIIYDLQTMKPVASIPEVAYTVQEFEGKLLVGGIKGIKWVDIPSSGTTRTVNGQ